MKLCTKCKQTKSLEFFHKGKVYADGYRSWCKVCVSTYKKQYRITNAEQLKKNQAEYDAVHNPLRREYFAQRYKEKKDHILATNKAYRVSNPQKNAAKETKRRAAKINRTPKWLTPDDLWMIEQAYELASLRTKIFGFKWQVDHVLPLQGKIVSGFHVPENLQVIPACVNQKKSNLYEVSF
jgi:hypothetical protein